MKETNTKPKTMTDEAITTIAEAMGWKIEQHECGRRLRRPDGTVAHEYYAEAWRLPQYPSDLSEAIKLSGAGWQLHAPLNSPMWKVVAPNNGSVVVVRNISLAHAISETFLRVRGLWKEGA